MAWNEVKEFERLLKEKNPNFDRFAHSSSLHALVALLKTANPTATAVQLELDKIPDKKDEKYKTALAYLGRHFPGVDEVIRGNLKLKGFARIADKQKRLYRAEQAVGRCKEVVGMCQIAISKVVGNSPIGSRKPAAQWSEPERKSTGLFQKWLDDKRAPSNVDRVRMVFNKMEEALRRQTWEIVAYGTPEDPDPEGLKLASAFAFVVPGENTYRIYLASLFWLESQAPINIPTVAHATAAATPAQWQKEKEIKTAMDAAIVTMIHELCHVNAICGKPYIDDVQPEPYRTEDCMERAKKHPNLALTNAENYAQFASALLMSKHFF